MKMGNTTVSMQDEKSLWLTAHIAIGLGHASVWNRSRSPQEPDFVSEMVTVSVPILGQCWNQILQAYNTRCSATGVFIHQSPMVTTQSGQKTCELGDILFVYVHHVAGFPKKGRAQLVQAKVSATPTAPLSSKDPQFLLYSQWPAFRYSRPAALRSITRNVIPKTAHDGAKYMLIDPSPPGNWSNTPLRNLNSCPFGMSRTQNPVSISSMLPEELVGILGSSTGRDFDVSPNTTDQWSSMIHDLLRVTFQGVFNRVNIRRTMTHRGVTAGGAMVPPNMKASRDTHGLFLTNYLTSEQVWRIMHFSSDSGEPIIPSDEAEEDEFGGISVVLIETNHLED